MLASQRPSTNQPLKHTMNKSINLMMASAVVASSVALMSCAETAAVNDTATQVSHVVVAKDAKVATVTLALTGLK